MELCQRHAKSQRVHQATYKQQFLALTVGQILVKQQQVVAEVEVGLPGVAIGKAAATQVIDMARRQHQQVFTGQTNAPAQVYLLHMGKEILVQSADVLIKLTAHHQACPGCPKDALGPVVILPMVILDIFKDAPTAIGIAVAVYVTTRGSGIVKHRLFTVLAVMQQFGHHSTHFGMRLHIVQQRVEPSLRRTHIAVEQHRVRVHRLGNRQIIPLCKAVVLVKLQHLDLGKLLLKHLQAVVGAAVVGNNHVGNGGIGARNHRGQIAPQQFSTVPIQYDDTNLFHRYSLINKPSRHRR